MVCLQKMINQEQQEQDFSDLWKEKCDICKEKDGDEAVYEMTTGKQVYLCFSCNNRVDWSEE